METTATQTMIGPGRVISAKRFIGDLTETALSSDPSDAEFELAVWLIGLESFINQRSTQFGTPQLSKANGDRTSEFRLVRYALSDISQLAIQIRRYIEDPSSEIAITAKTAKAGVAHKLDRLTRSDLDDLSSILRSAIVITESMLESGNLGQQEWKAWGRLISGNIRSYSAIKKLDDRLIGPGLAHAPKNLREMMSSGTLSFSDRSDVNAVISRFSATLRSLEIVGRMLRNDVPLKPAILVFAAVYEQVRGVIEFVNNRLSRMEDERSELFGLLDAASYTASIEMNKAFGQELEGVAAMRPVPMIYARIEAAYSLLNDSFRQILTGFAGLTSPGVEIPEVFPEFRAKLDQSILLREQIWKLLGLAQRAEEYPDEKTIGELKSYINRFLEESSVFLFYKDLETVERFCEEIMVSSGTTDLVPIFHRFAAYLETLFGQVKMRAVLQNHPFVEK